MRCDFCGSEGECYPNCDCAKCKDPESYEDWRDENPEAYEKWLDKKIKEEENEY